MNVRLKKIFEFHAGLVYENRLSINQYQLTLDLLTVSTDRFEQNVAYERMKYWIHEVMDQSILIGQNSDMLDVVDQLHDRVIVLPTEPVDQITGIMLYLKLNSIMESRLVVTDVEICSLQGDYTTFLHSVGENLGPDLAQDGWWTDARPIWSMQKTQGRGKVVSLDRAPDWKDYDLDWTKTEDDKKDSVVFANFKKDETE